MWKKIDPKYIKSGSRIDLANETPICTVKEYSRELAYPKEYGTITEFYFLFDLMLHYGLMHSMRKLTDVRKLVD